MKKVVGRNRDKQPLKKQIIGPLIFEKALSIF